MEEAPIITSRWQEGHNCGPWVARRVGYAVATAMNRDPNAPRRRGRSWRAKAERDPTPVAQFELDRPPAFGALGGRHRGVLASRRWDVLAGLFYRTKGLPGHYLAVTGFRGLGSVVPLMSAR